MCSQTLPAQACPYDDKCSGLSLSGGEIADKFGLTRQKVFYHMSKLLTLGLGECNAESGRPYYSLKKQSLEEVIAAISMLVNED